MFSLGCPWNIPSCIFLQLQQIRAQQQLSVGIDTRQRDHDDAGVMRPWSAPRMHCDNNFCHLVFLRGPAGALLSVVGGYLKTKERVK